MIPSLVVLPHDDVGSGAPVVLLHAGIADRSMWIEVTPALVAAGYRVIAMDLPGFGEAPPAPQQAPHVPVIETIDALGLDEVALVGNSFGGAVALRVAVVAPERVSSLALVSAPAPGIEPSDELEAAWDAEELALTRGDVEAAVEAVVAAWTLPGATAAQRKRIAEMQRRAFELQATVSDPETDADDFLEADPEAMRTVAVPTLVTVGELDMPDFHLAAQAFTEQLQDASMLVIPDARHLAPIENPGVLVTALLAHLAGVRQEG